MSQEVAPKTVVKVGIYGNTYAGKTRFLYELIRKWQDSRRILQVSDGCTNFMSTTHAEMETHGATQPTAAKTEDIRCGATYGSTAEPKHFLFRDLRGEELAKQLDKIDDLPSKHDMPAQVATCDAFLFLFDPTCGELDEGDIPRRYEQELKRAKKFIRYLVTARQNRLLPVLFAQTHADVLESRPELTDRADQWLKDISEFSRSVFREHLDRMFPREAFEHERITTRLASHRDGNMEEIAERLWDMAQSSKDHLRRHRKKKRAVILAITIFAVAILPIMGGVLLSSGGEVVVKGLPPVPTEPASEGDLQAEIKSLEDVCAAIPKDTHLPTRNACEKLNEHLRPIVIVYQNSGAMPSDMVARARSAIDAAADALSVLRTAVQRGQSRENVELLAVALTGLPDCKEISGKLALAQQEYWSAVRRLIVTESAALLSQQKEGGASAEASIDALLGFMRDQINELESSGVYSSGARDQLLSDARSSIVFCEGLKEAGFRPVSIEINAASGPKGATRRFLEFRLGPHSFDKEAPEAKHYILLTASANSVSFVPDTKLPRMGLKLRPYGKVALKGSSGGTWSSIVEPQVPQVPGPLSRIGLPFWKLDGTPMVIGIAKDDYRLEIAVKELCEPPSLLVEAAKALEGAKE